MRHTRYEIHSRFAIYHDSRNDNSQTYGRAPRSCRYFSCTHLDGSRKKIEIWQRLVRRNQSNRFTSSLVPFVSCLFRLPWPSLPSVRAHNVRFAGQADLLRPTDKHTTDVPAYSETLREGGNSHAAARSSAMDRRVFPRSGERRGASGEGTFLFVQTRSRDLLFRSYYLSLRSIIHRATCAISCCEENLALEKKKAT